MGNAMSKPTNDYWFYTITCKDEDISDFYIGSTRNWNKREYKHKSKCKIGSDVKVYRYINEYGGWDNWIMSEICFQENLTSLEARIMEDILMEELGSTLNNNAAFLSLENSKLYRHEYLKDYRKNNKEVIAKYNKDYYEKHKDKLNKKVRKKITCECGITTAKCDIAKHRKTTKHNKRLNEQK